VVGAATSEAHVTNAPTRNPLVAALLRIRLFQGLTPLQLTEIARNAERVTFRPGDLLTAAGQPADGAILIVAGDCDRVIESVPARLEPVETGSLIGEMSMFVDHVYGATVRARGPVRALRITRKAIHAQMLEDRSLAEHCVERIAQRLNGVAAELRRIDTAVGATILPHPTAPRPAEPGRLAAPPAGVH
jgi:CRP-like cAMP-binding protein